MSRAEAFDLDPRLVTAIRDAGGASAVLLSGFVALIARYTGLEAFAVLSAADADGAARGGPTVNCDLSGDPTFAELADRINVTTGGAGDAAAPIMFSTSASDLTGLALELACTVIDRGASIVVELGYDASLFDRPTIRRLGEHLQVLLADGLAHP
jgi:hypothetical protein